MKKVKGTVYSTFTANDTNDKSMFIEVDMTPEELADLIGANMKIDCPVKIGTDENEGRTFLKVHSRFDVAIYDNKIETDEIDFSNIGRCSLVEVAFTVKEGKYKNRKYQSAYLRAVNVIDLVEYVASNPFE